MRQKEGIQAIYESLLEGRIACPWKSKQQEFIRKGIGEVKAKKKQNSKASIHKINS